MSRLKMTACDSTVVAVAVADSRSVTLMYCNRLQPCASAEQALIIYHKHELMQTHRHHTIIHLIAPIILCIAV